MLVTQASKNYVIINQLKGTAHSVFSTLLIKNIIGSCRRDFSVAQALSTCMSCIMRVPGVDGGGGGGIPHFWPKQACAVHLFVVMSLRISL